MYRLLNLIGIVTVTLVLAGFPELFKISGETIVFSVSSLSDTIQNYFKGIPGGETFLYKSGYNTRSFVEDVGEYFVLSYGYLVLAGIISIAVGILIGVWLAHTRKEWVKDIVGFLGTIPDFVFVIFLQFSVIAIYQGTGFKYARVASFSVQHPAVLLPIITLTLIPAIYLINTISNRTYQVITEDYILTAKAKGLKKYYIYLQHVFRNVIPFIKADLHKVTTIMVGNLFIIEYLYNLRGVTRLMFSNGYQYNLVVNSLIVIIFLYLMIYWAMRLFIKLLERNFAHD